MNMLNNPARGQICPPPPPPPKKKEKKMKYLVNQKVSVHYKTHRIKVGLNNLPPIQLGLMGYYIIKYAQNIKYCFILI
mgnify:CR=1 FL=1